VGSNDVDVGLRCGARDAVVESVCHLGQRRARYGATGRAPISLVNSYEAAGQGYYAHIAQSPVLGVDYRGLHVDRPSDARHWQVPAISDVMPVDVIFLDAEQVWYVGTTLNGATSTIIRQRLEALGAGD